ncbi:MAG TPA: S4 domain-containing protein, partial [Atribacterota bacterium]|nr:S4 domain-containing protein [Atribacterota bacterium]
MDYQKKIKEIEFSGQENIRIDIFLSREDIVGLSRSRIKELVTKGDIVVNGKKVKPSYILKTGETILIDIPAEK